MANYYRFRTLDKLIGSYKELENQEIYFSAPDGLNDPMEGFSDIFWNGDRIIWTNLIQHYLWCLHRAACIVSIMGDEPIGAALTNLVFSSRNNAETLELKLQHIELCKNFFSISNAGLVSELLEKRKTPVRREELSIVLQFLHPRAIHCISHLFKSRGLLAVNAPTPPLDALNLKGVIERWLA